MYLPECGPRPAGWVGEKRYFVAPSEAQLDSDWLEECARKLRAIDPRMDGGPIIIDNPDGTRIYGDTMDSMMPPLKTL